MVASVNGQKQGKIIQVIGSTFDAEFDEGHLPEIYNALKIDGEYKGVKVKLTGEVQQHLGGNRVRCVALGSTDGLYRGMEVIDRLVAGDQPVKQEALLRDLCDTMLAGSLCALGGMAPFPVLSALNHFPEDFKKSSPQPAIRAGAAA